MKKLLLVFLLARPAAARAAEELQTVVVRPGDTLWSIANVYLKDPTKWDQILKYNKLPASDPSIALPGMALKVPMSLIKEQYRAAKLVYFLNDVLYRRAGASDWSAVAVKMDLFNNDTLRTQAAARADVRFYTGQQLSIFANSMTVLRPPDNKNADVKLLAGEIRSIHSRVVTQTAKIIPKTKDTEFGARVKEDLTTLVQVYKGRADVEAQGKTVEVREGFATEVKMDLPPSAPVELPPSLEFDQKSQTKLASLGSPKLSMDGGVVSLNMKAPKAADGRAQLPDARTMKDVPSAGDLNDKRISADDAMKLISVGNPVQAYHLQVSRDQNFSTLVLDKSYDALENIDLNDTLPPGSYWMRVSLVDLLGFEGKYNTPRQIKVGR